MILVWLGRKHGPNLTGLETVVPEDFRHYALRDAEIARIIEYQRPVVELVLFDTVHLILSEFENCPSVGFDGDPLRPSPTA